MTDRGNPIDERALDRLIEDVGDERAHRLLRAFTSETQRRMERILALAGERSLTALRDECHTLKGSAGSLGAVAVERQANAIVAACLTGDSADAWSGSTSCGAWWTRRSARSTRGSQAGPGGIESPRAAGRRPPDRSVAPGGPFPINRRGTDFEQLGRRHDVAAATGDGVLDQLFLHQPERPDDALVTGRA